MFNPRYAQVIMFIFITYSPFSDLIEGYKLGYTGISSLIIFSIVFLLILIWGYRKNKHIYSIHNVKKTDVINIIEEYIYYLNCTRNKRHHFCTIFYIKTISFKV